MNLHPQHLSLFELNRLVANLVQLEMPEYYWVEAELMDLRESNGHCYMEFIQKDEAKTTVAKAAARCWRNTWTTVKRQFTQVTGQMPASGMKVLAKVKASFHENYGFAYIIADIDPTFTLGDMARKRREIVETLKRKGIFDDNHALALPLFCQNIAVISAQNAAGYGDFCKQLLLNDYHLRFSVTLFPATVQGEGLEQSVIAALNDVAEREEEFDCVVIMRGGGSTSDLSGFDSLPLAENVANFPIPVITAIGHDRDETVLDLIAHASVKTPTAAATFFTDRLLKVMERITRAQQTLYSVVTQRIKHELLHVEHLAASIPRLFDASANRQKIKLQRINYSISARAQHTIAEAKNRLQRIETKLPAAAQSIITGEKHRVQLIEQQITLLDPQQLLNRGYSITTYQGRAVTDASSLPEGAIIHTRVKHGTVISKTLSNEQ